MPLRWDKGLTGKEWDLYMANRHAERRRARDLDGLDLATVLMWATVLLLLAVAVETGR